MGHGRKLVKSSKMWQEIPKQEKQYSNFKCLTPKDCDIKPQRGRPLFVFGKANTDKTQVIRKEGKGITMNNAKHKSKETNRRKGEGRSA